LTEADLKPELHVVGGGVQKADYRARYVMIGVVLVIVAYMGWYLLRSETISPSGFLSVEENAQETETDLILSSETDEDTAEATITSELSTEADSQDPTENETAASDASDDSGTESNGSTSVDASVSDTTLSQIMIKATSSTWVELKTEAEETLVAKLLMVDEMIAIPDDGIYTLTTGNAGALLIGYQGDDASWKTLGGNGDILQMKAIDHSLLKD